MHYDISIDKELSDVIEKISNQTIISMSSSDYAHTTLSVKPNTRTYNILKKTYEFFDNLYTQKKNSCNTI